MDNIPYGKQEITAADIEAVTQTLKADYLTQGPQIAAFEKAFAIYTGSNYAVALSNGTAALHLSCLGLGVKEGTNVITTPITFAASANAVRYCGGNVHFVDIDPKTYLIDLRALEELIKSKPKGYFSGVIPVNFSGKVVNIEKLQNICKPIGIWILEDACHSPGGSFTDSTQKEIKAGSSAYSNASIFSFHPVKHIACGEGGMVTTNDQDLYRRLLSLRTHGITKNTEVFSNVTSLASASSNKTYPGWYMEMQELGYNYRLTDIQASLGLSQLTRAEKGIEKRRAIAKRYHGAFDQKKHIIGHSTYKQNHAYHLYILEVNDRLGLYQHLRKNKIFTQIHYFPCHLMPYYQKLGWKKGDFPHAEKYYAHCISIPMYPSLTEHQQQRVIANINDYFA